MTDEIGERAREWVAIVQPPATLHPELATRFENAMYAALRAQAASTREKVEKEIADYLAGDGRLLSYRETIKSVRSGAYRSDKPKEE